MQTSRGGAEYGRRELEAVGRHPPAFFAGYLKRITAGWADLSNK